jgi:fatty acid-binding protein DegV
MALRNGLMVDASAELPHQALLDPLLRVVPVRVLAGGQTIIDQRDASITRQFNDTLLGAQHAASSRSLPLKMEEIADFVLRHVATDFDHAFGLFPARTYSPMFDRAFDAASRVIASSMPVRNAIGLKGPLLTECYDSQSLFSGYGVQVLEVLRMMSMARSQTTIRSRLEAIIPRTVCLVAPRDWAYMHARAKAKGENINGSFDTLAARWLKLMPVIAVQRGQQTVVAKARTHLQACDELFKRASRALDDGLEAPFLNISYSGNLQEIDSIDGIVSLRDHAERRGVQMTLSEMSPANSLMLGSGALTVAFIA